MATVDIICTSFSGASGLNPLAKQRLDIVIVQVIGELVNPAFVRVQNGQLVSCANVFALKLGLFISGHKIPAIIVDVAKFGIIYDIVYHGKARINPHLCNHGHNVRALTPVLSVSSGIAIGAARRDLFRIGRISDEFLISGELFRHIFGLENGKLLIKSRRVLDSGTSERSDIDRHDMTFPALKRAYSFQRG